MGLGPGPAGAGLLEEDIRRDAERSWEEWRCGSLGSEACRRCWPTSARLSPLYRFLLLPRLLAAGKESSSHPPHLPLSGLGWPSLPTLPQRWLAPAVSLGPVNAALGHGRKAAREPMAVAAVFTCSGFIASPPPRTDAHCALPPTLLCSPPPLPPLSSPYNIYRPASSVFFLR